MTDPVERNLGEQPIARLLAESGKKPHDLVAAITPPITHKMVARACKGRRLTPHAQSRICQAYNLATGQSLRIDELFTYKG